MKELHFNKKETSKLYVMSFLMQKHFESEYEVQEAYLKKGYISKETFEITKDMLRLAKELHQFLKEAETTFITELPF